MCKIPSGKINHIKPKLRLFASNPHPSTRINNISLKGREIITGGSISIPALRRTLAMTISISKKGMNKRHPISKAVRNSLIINDGIMICRPRSIGLAGFSIWAIWMKSVKSTSRV
jgi:hypothetical protein